MSPISRCFPYGKSIVTNALYDTIEALGLSLDSADSLRGVFIVSNEGYNGKMRIALAFGTDEVQTCLEICPENAEENFVEIWSPIIIDELEGSMKQVHLMERSKKESEKDKI